MNLKLFVAGSCCQMEKMVLRSGKWKSIRFPSTFALIEHPTEGNCLFDTGYSSYVLEGTKFYDKITPIAFEEWESAANQVRGFAIKKIIISHFHIDHIGGLRDFPKAQFLFSREAGESIRNLTGLKALKAAFMPSLLPDDFWERSSMISEFPYKLGLPEFEYGYDIFGDGSVVAVSLPGHAQGQIGVFVRMKDKTVLLAADACWQSQAYQELIYPHPLARLIIDDNRAYDATLKKLHNLHRRRPDIAIIPTHCQEALCLLA